ncbi:U-box domain-containing protein 35 [Camellia lanceoleosa]|uniref:U-box domain-containing protein 35 n=1 Tax=Camellia lanceoleosa TaxID=1840588 RepID=A0ACC0GML1_9ERIC|nr:U-box domain-containing protein 35 [Camellia lanceoleosa]
MSVWATDFLEGFGDLCLADHKNCDVAAYELQHTLKRLTGTNNFSRRIRHPHLLILLGACPDYGSLVYEYMENGSLEDRLLRKNNTPPIPWFERYRISWEVTSALVFLHNSNPQPIIHRDLKPANILLDRNFVSKIGDVELSKMLESDPSVISTMCKDTGLLLTAKPAVALAHVVEIAVDDGNFADLLDLEAGNWPIEETKELAVLGLKCMELRRRDRPDLRDQVLPALEILKEFADRAQGMASNAQPAPPNHFICPILQDIMEEPCVAADGYTYDRKAIQTWLEENDKSPMTNLPLPTRNLIPNYTLLSAISEWKSGKQ